MVNGQFDEVSEVGEQIGASEFKARCLALLHIVAETRAEYTITKHGRPVAKIAARRAAAVDR